MTANLRNWAGNYTYRAARLHYPETVEQVQELVSRSHKVKALGSRHSFNGISDSPGDMISLDLCPRMLVIDHNRRTVTVDGATRYGELCPRLDNVGFALPSLASLPHISVAGAVATATHGSGDTNGNLATSVSAIELVTANGEMVSLSHEKDGEEFAGAVVGLGGLGVVTRLTLDLIPAFEMRQDVYENLPLDRLEEHFEEIVSDAYSVSLFTDWREARVNQVWLKRKVGDGTPFEPPPELFGAGRAPTDRHPIRDLSPESCTRQMGVVGRWYERLPHFRMEFTPSSGEELQTEYLLPRRHAIAALDEINGLRHRIAPLLQISEVRTIAADDLWMSPCYRQACVAIHFTWKKDWDAVSRLLPEIEERLEPLGARPHWGKLFAMPPERVQALYARLQDFDALLHHYDPEGKFRNGFLDRYVFGSRTP